MEELYKAIEEKIKASGYPRKISGEDVYDDICDQIDGKENGSYVLLSKFDDDVIFEYHITIMDSEFNLGVLTMRTPEGVFETDFDKTKLDTGVRKWTWFIKNGNGTDGTPYDVTQYKVKETRQVAMDHFGESDRWDTSEFEGLTPAGSTPDGLKWQKIQDIYDQEYPKIVNAASHDEAMAEYDKMISDMNDAGLEDVEKVITQNYQDRMKLWNE